MNRFGRLFYAVSLVGERGTFALGNVECAIGHLFVSKAESHREKDKYCSSMWSCSIFTVFRLSMCWSSQVLSMRYFVSWKYCTSIFCCESELSESTYCNCMTWPELPLREVLSRDILLGRWTALNFLPFILTLTDTSWYSMILFRFLSKLNLHAGSMLSGINIVGSMSVSWKVDYTLVGLEVWSRSRIWSTESRLR